MSNIFLKDRDVTVEASDSGKGNPAFAIGLLSFVTGDKPVPFLS